MIASIIIMFSMKFITESIEVVERFNKCGIEYFNKLDIKKIIVRTVKHEADYFDHPFFQIRVDNNF